MSRIVVFFLLIIAPALSLILALLGLETTTTNLLGWVLLALGIAYAAGVIAYYFIRKTAFWQSTGEVVRQEQGDRSFWAILPGMLGAFFAPPLEYLYMAAILPRTLQMEGAGLALILVGTALALWARSALRDMYSGHLQVTAGQSLVTQGPYRYIRHPSYAAFILVALGLAIGYSSLIGLAAIVVLLLPALAYRMRVEESVLASRFGDPYRLYQQRVHKLIPGIW